MKQKIISWRHYKKPPWYKETIGKITIGALIITAILIWQIDNIAHWVQQTF